MPGQSARHCISPMKSACPAAMRSIGMPGDLSRRACHGAIASIATPPTASAATTAAGLKRLPLIQSLAAKPSAADGTKAIITLRATVQPARTSSSLPRPRSPARASVPRAICATRAR